MSAISWSNHRCHLREGVSPSLHEHIFHVMLKARSHGDLGFSISEGGYSYTPSNPSPGLKPHGPPSLPNSLGVMPARAQLSRQTLDLLPLTFPLPSPLFYPGSHSFPEGEIEAAGKDQGVPGYPSQPTSETPHLPWKLPSLVAPAGVRQRGQVSPGWSSCLCPSPCPSGPGADALLVCLL